MTNTNQTFLEYHLTNMMLKGIAVQDEDSFYPDLLNKNQRRYKRLNFYFKGHRHDTFQEIPGLTPYLIKENQLCYNGKELENFPFERITAEDKDNWGSETSWYFKELPNRPDTYELRLNPINICNNVKHRTGANKEFRGCAFCHRVYAYRRSTENRKIVPTSEIFAQIFDKHGKDVIKKIKKVLMITGDAKDSEILINLIEKIYHVYLKPNGFKGVFSIATTQLRTREHLERLAAIDSTIFEFPIETFTNRNMLLGVEKGIDFEEVVDILRDARELFDYTRINYVVGLEALEEMRKGFTRLAEEGLVDDVIANIFTPFTPEMKTLRVIEANSPEYVLKAKKLLLDLGLTPKRAGVTKTIFYEQYKLDGKDLLVEKNK